jgi:hypothetical protein
LVVKIAAKTKTKDKLLDFFKEIGELQKITELVLVMVFPKAKVEVDAHCQETGKLVILVQVFLKDFVAFLVSLPAGFESPVLTAPFPAQKSPEKVY